MNDKTVVELNELIKNAYECRSFEDFLRLAITRLHTVIMYDSGLFYCAISRDCSFFQPYISGSVDAFYAKTPFGEQESYLQRNEKAATEAMVYKAVDFRRGLIAVPEEPRSEFLAAQEDFHIVCMRIVYHGQFLGEIYLHRNKNKPDFDNQELFLLQLLQPHVSTVFHIIHTITAVRLLETDKQGLDRKGLCLFDGDGNLIAGNVAGLEILNNSTIFGSSVLYHLKETMTDIYEQHQSSKENFVYHKSHVKTPGSELSAEIYYKFNSRRKEDSRFSITLEFADDKQLAKEYRFKFTKREADIIDGVLQGKSNPKIAASLVLSENTVKTHLQNIFQKTGVSSRSELVYILMLKNSQA